jgi:hypothetical protein
MDLIAIVIGLVVGIPLWALTYWWTRRNAKLGLGSGYSGDTPSSGGASGGGGGGSPDGT